MKILKIASTLLFITFTTFFFSQKSHETCANLKAKKINNKSNTLTINQIIKTEKYDVSFYKLDLNMTNSSTYLSGIVEVHGKTNVSLDSVLIELFDTFTINEIRLNDVNTNFNRYQTVIAIPVNLNANQTFKIAINYQGTPPTESTNPLGGSGMTNDFSPSWGNQVTWSLSEPFSAFEWFPCKQSLNDKADSVFVNITVPDTCKAGSNGILTSITTPINGFSTYHWEHRHPIDYYLISVAVANYVDYSIYANPVGSDPILIQNYIYSNPETLPFFQTRIDETADFIELFSNLFGLYPFHNEKYGHCMAPIGGGMEHQTMTTQGSFSKGLTSHELAHQWWGDNVTCNSWADIWVNEGFASYSEYLMLENLYPDEKNQDMFDRHDYVMSEPNGSTYVIDSLNSGRIFDGRLTYDKGASIIHTFRYLLNNDFQFFQALKNYQTNFGNKTALGIDFQHTLENVSGLNLSEAFEQWYFGEGYPTYSATWNMVNNELHVVVSQTVSAPSVTPFFTNPIDLKFKRLNLSDTIIRFNVNGTSTNFILPVNDIYTELSIIDPNNWIINKVDTIIRDVALNLTGINENNNLNEITLYPNPSSDYFGFTGKDFSNYELTIIDPKGQHLISKTISSTDKIDVKNFSSGIYLIQLSSKSGDEIIRKIFKK